MIAHQRKSWKRHSRSDIHDPGSWIHDPMKNANCPYICLWLMTFANKTHRTRMKESPKWIFHFSFHEVLFVIMVVSVFVLIELNRRFSQWMGIAGSRWRCTMPRGPMTRESLRPFAILSPKPWRNMILFRLEMPFLCVLKARRAVIAGKLIRICTVVQKVVPAHGSNTTYNINIIQQ